MVTVTAPSITTSQPPRATQATPCEPFFAAGDQHAELLDPPGTAYRTLWEAMRDAAGGGKGARPQLVTRTYAALGGTDLEVATHVGDAVELLHGAFVMHDDVIDHDITRRGRLNVSGQLARRARAAGASPEAATAFGDAAGILAGDLAIAGAITAVARTKAPQHVVAKLLELFEEAVRTTAAGELADVELSLGTLEPSLEDVLQMEERKTAVYSFVLPLQAAATLVDTERATTVLPILDLLGRHLGLAFQLQDDVLGTFGDPEHTGKSNLTDLREGKHTPIIAHARTTGAWETVAPFHGTADLDEQGAAIARSALEACGSRAFVEALAFDHMAAARALARAADLPHDLVEWLGALPSRAARQSRAA